MQLDFPVEVSGLRLDHNCFSYKGLSHKYSEIISLSFQHQLNSYNGIPTGNFNTLMIKVRSGAVISITCNTGFMFQKNKKVIPAIYKYLYDISFNAIVARYLNFFSENGYIDYEFKSEIGALGAIGSSRVARIYPNGDVRVGDKIVNLQKARINGVLALGTEYGISISGYTRPHEIAMSETKGVLWTRLVKINAQWDTNIVFAIFKGLAEGKQFLAPS